MEKTAENKVLLKKLVLDVFISGDYDKMSNFFDDDNYIQHNSWFADELSGLLSGLEEMAKTRQRNEIYQKLYDIGRRKYGIIS